jgi:penicillin-binding protein 1B
LRDVLDASGRVLSGRPPRPEQVVSEAAAFLVTDMLRGVLTRGTGAAARALGFAGDAAGKTGTTDDTRDAWFVGYTPELLGLAWVGYDDNAKTGLTGASGALPIWTDFMHGARHRWGLRAFAPPEGIVRVAVDPESGGRATRKCPRTVDEIFGAGTEPTEDCPIHGSTLRRWFQRVLPRRDERPSAGV